MTAAIKKTVASAEAAAKPAPEPVIAEASNPFTFMLELRRLFLAGYVHDHRQPFELKPGYCFAHMVAEGTEGLE